MTVDVYLEPEQFDEKLRADAYRGLTSTPKYLSPTWLYDARGSTLFEEITRLPEYYPTRTEFGLLRQFAGEIADSARPEMLVELGSGSSEKTRVLLDALEPYLHTYVPQDVSEPALRTAVAQLSVEYPRLSVHGVVGDFTESLEHLPSGGRRMVAFLGGTIGNLVPEERAAFLSGLASILDRDEWLLLGAGLVVDPEPSCLPPVPGGPQRRLQRRRDRPDRDGRLPRARVRRDGQDRERPQGHGRRGRHDRAQHPGAGTAAVIVSRAPAGRRRGAYSIGVSQCSYSGRRPRTASK